MVKAARWAVMLHRHPQHNPFKAVYDTPRQSVYLMTQRIQRHPFLTTLDGADSATSTPARLTSTTPVQALFLLNNSGCMSRPAIRRAVPGCRAGRYRTD